MASKQIKVGDLILITELGKESVWKGDDWIKDYVWEVTNFTELYNGIVFVRVKPVASCPEIEGCEYLYIYDCECKKLF